MIVGAFNRYLCGDRHLSPPRKGNKTAAAWQQHRRQPKFVIPMTGTSNLQHNEQQVAVVLSLSVRHADFFWLLAACCPRPPSVYLLLVCNELGAEQQAWQQLLTNPSGIFESKNSKISSNIHMWDDKFDDFEGNLLTVCGVSDMITVIA